MIKLDCPGCEKGLEIDEGFAGGICRCYDCGTLMTVPEAGGAAERLERAGRPDTPGGRPATPGGSAARPKVPEQGAETFVTSTGKQVKVTDEQLRRVVVARKAHMGVRAAVIGGFVALVVILIVLLVILSANMLKQAERERLAAGGTATGQAAGAGPEVVGTDIVETLFTYDPTANPYLIEEPNLFGLPIETDADQTTLVVVDTSMSMRQHLDFVKEVLAINVRRIGEATRLQAAFATDAGPELFPEAPTPPAAWDTMRFQTLLDEMQAVGAARLSAAVERALASQPKRLLLVFSLKPVSFEFDKTDSLLEDKDIAVDVVQVGRFDMEVQALAERHGGRYVDLPEGQIEQWYLDYLNREQP